jgi:hypothetical protein
MTLLKKVHSSVITLINGDGIWIEARCLCQTRNRLFVVNSAAISMASINLESASALINPHVEGSNIRVVCKLLREVSNGPTARSWLRWDRCKRSRGHVNVLQLLNCTHFSTKLLKLLVIY